MPTDPVTTLREAREHTERGEYAEALQLYRWFDQHALEHDASLYGVRRAALFKRWAQLADLHSPARQELEMARDSRTNALCDGNHDVDLFGDVESINHALGQWEKTRDLFAELAAANRDFAMKCFRTALAALVQVRDFSLAYEFLSEDFLRRSLLELDFNLADIGFLDSADRAREVYFEIYAEDLYRVITVVAGVGKAGEARTLYREAVVSIPDPEIRDAIRNHLTTLSEASDLDSVRQILNESL